MVKAIRDYRKFEIVQAAVVALSENGLSNLSYDVIALEADTSRQLVRRYYPDSEVLMMDVCDSLTGVYQNLKNEVFTDHTHDNVSLFLDFFFDLLSVDGRSKPNDNGAFTALTALSANTEMIRKSLVSHYSFFKDMFAQELLKKYPQLGADKCDELGFLFVSLYYGHWRMVSALGFSKANAAHARSAVERLIDTYLAEI